MRQDLDLDPGPGGGAEVPDEGTGTLQKMLLVTPKEERVSPEVEENFSTASKMSWW